jgi:parallel beta-helix repeat protein
MISAEGPTANSNPDRNNITLNKQDDYQQLSPIAFSYSPRGVIRINNDSDFTNASGVVWGDGSENDPYIISGWDINGSSWGNCIYIGNTTKYFAIQDCYAHHAVGKRFYQYYREAGILLFNVTNGTIKDSKGSDSYYNIYIDSSADSKIINTTLTNSTYPLWGYINNNITVEQNRIIGAGQAVYFTTGSNITVQNNNCTTGEIRFMSSSDENTIHNNTCNGIALVFTNNNLVSENDMTNGTSGIIISTSHNNKLYDNKMKRYGISLIGSKDTYTTQTIPTNNTVSGKPIYYYANADMKNALVPSDAGQVICANVTKMRIQNLNLQDLNTAVLIAYSSQIRISDNDFSNNTYGIRLTDSFDITVIDNTCNWNSNSGIYLMDMSPVTMVTGNTLMFNDKGLYVYYSSLIEISGNKINNNVDYGIYLARSDNLTITSNNCSYNSYGIGLDDPNYNHTIAQNTLWHNQIGIWMESIVAGDSMAGNVFQYNNISLNDQHGVKIDLDASTNSKFNLFANNSIYNNNWSGIMLRESYMNGFWYNNLSNNLEYGINASLLSKYNLIHHNNFINNNGGTVQVKDEGTSNTWDDQTGEGNYWSDYIKRYPSATNDGRVWDTPYDINLSSGSSDRYPLANIIETAPPLIIDISINTGYTGDKYTFICDIIDNVKVSSAYVKFWFGDINNAVNISLNFNATSGYWMNTITLPGNSTEPMNYIISAVDVNSNWMGQVVSIVDVIDNDPPTAVATTDKKSYLEGDTVYFNGTGSHDNIGVLHHEWHFFYDNDDVYLYVERPIFVFDIPGNYIIIYRVWDNAGGIGSAQFWVNVTEVQKPEFWMYAVPKLVQMDNPIDIEIWVGDSNGGGINTVKVHYTDVFGNSFNETMNHQSGMIWTFTIPAQPKTGSPSLFFWMSNNFGKWNKSKTINIAVEDWIWPEILNVKYPLEVEEETEINIIVEVRDNAGISEVILDYIDTNDIEYSVSMIKGQGMNYTYTIPGQKIPPQQYLGVVDFVINVTDVNNNWNRSRFCHVQILEVIYDDNEPPGIIETDPENGAVNVDVGTDVTITFNDSMNHGSVNHAITITPDELYNLIWSNNISVLEIDITLFLNYNQTYTIAIGIGAMDKAGNALVEEFVFNFTTIKESAIKDFDGDGMDDEWEIANGLDPTNDSDAGEDPDNDNLTNYEEFIRNIDPNDPDTDKDGLKDGDEVKIYQTEPHLPDTDSDGFIDKIEVDAGSNPKDPLSTPRAIDVDEDIVEEEIQTSNYIPMFGTLIILIILLLIAFMLLYRRELEKEMAKPKITKKKEMTTKRTVMQSKVAGIDEGEAAEEEVVEEDEEGLECPECGAPLVEKDKFCPDCGAAFEEEGLKKEESLDEEIEE